MVKRGKVAMVVLYLWLCLVKLVSAAEKTRLIMVRLEDMERDTTHHQTSAFMKQLLQVGYGS